MTTGCARRGRDGHGAIRPPSRRRPTAPGVGTGYGPTTSLPAGQRRGMVRQPDRAEGGSLRMVGRDESPHRSDCARRPERCGVTAPCDRDRHHRRRLRSGRPAAQSGSRSAGDPQRHRHRGVGPGERRDDRGTVRRLDACCSRTTPSAISICAGPIPASSPNEPRRRTCWRPCSEPNGACGHRHGVERCGSGSCRSTGRGASRRVNTPRSTTNWW